MLEILGELKSKGFRNGGDYSGNPTGYERSVVQRNRSEKTTISVPDCLPVFLEQIKNQTRPWVPTSLRTHGLTHSIKSFYQWP